MTPRRLSELDRADRHRALVRTALIVTLSWTALVGIYYWAPAGRDIVVSALPRLAVALLMFAAVLAWQTSRIVDAELPELRAAQALGVIIPLFLVVFATAYLSLSHTAASNFSQPLDHTGALYFTITVFSTVGFGDITPKTDVARIIVSIQMLLDLVLLGVVVRLLFNAARTGLARAEQDPADPS